jgi:hypothetical protein
MNTQAAKEAPKKIVWNEIPGDLPATEVSLNHLFNASDKLILKTESGEELKGRYLVYTRDHAYLNFTAKKWDAYFGNIHDLQIAGVVAWAFDQKPNENHSPDGK